MLRFAMLSKHVNLIKAGLEGCYFSGAHQFAKTWLGGVGAVLALRHVKPRILNDFQPNRAHEITPEFLEQAIVRLRENGFDIVSLDEAARRLAEPGSHNKFVAFTFDGGYRDVGEHAYPVLKKHKCPFTVYVPTAFPDGEGLLWWRALEQVIANRDVVTIEVDGEPRIYLSTTLEEKFEAFADISWWLMSLDEKKLPGFMADFCGTFNFDMKALCREQCMNWHEIAQLAADPLVTIGAQTLDHVDLSKLNQQELLRQIREGARILESTLGKRPQHFSYPFGTLNTARLREFDIARELGFTTAVTMREGILYKDHATALHALPRLPLSGEYQSMRYLDVLLSGLPSYVMNGFEKLSVA
jgi:peptidoglycan/xylan/chitin deacetylase (PgdA/CDA1 family)